MMSNPDLVHASMQALVDGGYLQDADEAVGVIDADMVNNIASFLLDAGILRDEDGQPLATLPDVSTWFSNAYLSR
jgi:hypothetical protein